MSARAKARASSSRSTLPTRAMRSAAPLAAASWARRARRGPSPYMYSSVSRSPQRAMAEVKTRTTWRGRLSSIQRNEATTRSGRRSSRPAGRSGRQSATVMPLGRTATGAWAPAASTWRASMEETAVRSAPACCQRRTGLNGPRAPTAPAHEPSTLWKVMAIGRPRRRAAAIPDQAKGETMPTCTWTTSGRSRFMSSSTSRRARGCTGSSPGRLTVVRNTRKPSGLSMLRPRPRPIGVAVTTAGSCPAARRFLARSRTWVSIPPRRGA